MALAAWAVAPEDDDAGRQWGGIALPLVGVNTVDGVGFGVGGEVFRRALGEDGDAYDLKVTASSFVTVTGRYQSHFFQLETRGDVDWVFQSGFSKWTNLSYAGQGGAGLQTLRPPGQEAGNGMVAPYVMVALAAPVGKWSVLGQVFSRFARVRPRVGGLLDRDAPYGGNGGWFGDVAGGVFRDESDRWPLPRAGWVAEATLRVGVGVDRRGAVRAVGGPHVEVAGWWSAGHHLTLGGRLIVSQTVGEQPMFVQESLPGRWRDELGYEQALTGYGRTRARGDGLVAGIVEVRPRLGRLRAGFFDIGLHLSLFAEQGWLLDRWDPGPPLPTLGVGPVLVWQEATVLRPFFAWGWRGDVESADGHRRPVMQFGLALKDPL